MLTQTANFTTSNTTFDQILNSLNQSRDHLLISPCNNQHLMATQRLLEMTYNLCLFNWNRVKGRKIWNSCYPRSKRPILNKIMKVSQ